MQPFTDVTSPKLFTVSVPQASDAVGAVNEGVAVHSMVAFAPAVPMLGGEVSKIGRASGREGVWISEAAVALQIIVIVVVQPFTDVTSPKLFTVAVPQASDAVG